MGNTTDSTGKPTYTATPTQTVADLQAAANYAEKVGGLLKLTTDERTGLTSGQVKPGWLISETDTGNLYLSTGGVPQGVLIRGDSGWLDLPLASGWSVVSGDTPQYRVKDGAVRFRGRVSASTAAPQSLFTSVLDPIARPLREVSDRVTQTSGIANTYVMRVTSAGAVDVLKGSNAVDALSLVGFPPYLVD